MFKHIYIVFFLFATCVYSQNAFYNALQKQTQYRDSLVEESFKEDDVFELWEESDSEVDDFANFTDLAVKSLDVAGGFSWGNVAVATADIMKDRAIAELMATYFNKLKKEFDKEIVLSGGKKVALKNIMPNLYMMVKNAEETFINPSVGKTFISALENDLKDFVYNVDAYALTDNIKKDDVYKIFFSTYFSVQRYSEGMHPATILSELNYRFPIKEGDVPEFNAALNFIYIFTENLKSIKSKSHVWLDVRELTLLDETGWKEFFKELYSSSPVLFEYFNITLENINEQTEKFYKLKHLVERTALVLNSIESNYLNLNKSVGKLITAQNASEDESGKDESVKEDTESNINTNTDNMFLAYLNSFKSFVEIVVTVQDINNSNDFTNTELRKKLEVTNNAIELVTALKKKNYTMVLFKTARIIEQVDEGLADSLFKGNLIKYVALAGDVVSAKDAEEIKGVLEAAILPVGSHRLKSVTKNSLFINSYLGLSYGRETIVNNSKIGEDTKNILSLSAPVGFSYSWGLNKSGAITVFIPLLDLGSFVSYRFTENENVAAKSDSEANVQVSEFSNVTLDQLFAPGISLMYSPENTPITFGAGVQMVPRLRKIEVLENNSTDRQISDADTWRVSVQVLIDIPFFTLYASEHL